MNNMSTANHTDGETATSVNVEEVIRHLNNHYNRLLEDATTDCEKSPSVRKSNVTAIDYRKLGNEKFKDAHDHEALELYTKSAAYAAERSEELALAYANRSATLFRLQKYVSCLHDINRALGGSYPENLREKLRKRAEDCFIEISEIETNRAKDATPGKFSPIEADIIDLVAEMTPGDSSSPEDSTWRDLTRNFTNPLIPKASSKIKIGCDEKWGRHLVAAADINPGTYIYNTILNKSYWHYRIRFLREILSSQPFASLMLTENLRYQNCSYCLAECFALIPCSSCTKAMYCSSLCSERAYNSYHRIECKFQSWIRPSDFHDFDLMALRMLLIGTEQGTKLPNLMKRLTNKRDIFREKDDPTPNKPFVNDYFTLLKLCRTFQPSLVVNLTTIAIEHIVALKRVGFFGNDNSDRRLENSVPQQGNNLSETELFAALLYINHASAAKFNMMAISPITDSNLLCASCDKVIGSSICTLHHFLNHSCDPDVRFFNRNREHVLLAIRPIKKDQQIFYSYFNTFAINSIEERKRKLQSFGFSCHCDACCNLWPLETDMHKLNVKFLRDRTETKTEFLTKLKPVNELGDITKLRNHEIFEVLCRLCKWFYVHIEKPSVPIIRLECLIYDFTRLWLDDFSKTHMNEESRRYIEVTLNAIGNHVLGS